MMIRTPAIPSYIIPRPLDLLARLYVGVWGLALLFGELVEVNRCGCLHVRLAASVAQPTDLIFLGLFFACAAYVGLGTIRVRRMGRAG